MREAPTCRALAQLALGTAPIVGGARLAVGQLKAPDYRGLIKQDMDLLDRLPPEATARRADPPLVSSQQF
jgi:hypothetical protein